MRPSPLRFISLVVLAGIKLAITILHMSFSTSTRTLDFTFLDQSDFKQKYAKGLEQNQIRFYIGGMSCGNCVRKIENLNGKIEGLASLHVELGRNLAHVKIEPDVCKFSTIADEISALGFDPIPLNSESEADVVERLDHRRDLIRLAIGGAAAGNIMTFSFANYLGAPQDFTPLFNWLSFALYLPVVTFVAWPFYKGAWTSLKQKQISIDLPMAIASSLGFVFSTYNLLTQRPDLYFDSLSGFLFLILLSRFVQKNIQKSLLTARNWAEAFQIERVRLIQATGWTWKTTDSLKIGDRFLVEAPEVLAADAELLSSRAYFSMAWLSGEAKAKTFLKGSVVPAGAKLVSGEASFEVKKVLTQTSFGNILEQVQKFSLAKNRVLTLADRWAQWLLGVVLLLAILNVAFFWETDLEGAIQRSLALIILACPCAMAFGAPLALVTSLRKAQKAGLLIRDTNVFSQVQNVATLFFDKTGTLTETDLELTTDISATPSVYQKIVLSLENESFHPIAFAFRKAFKHTGPLPPCEGAREIPGQGVSGYIYGRHYEIKAYAHSLSQKTTCSLFEDEKLIFVFEFAATIKPDALETLRTLRKMNYEVRLLSGDQREVVRATANALEFAMQDVDWGLTPERKNEIVKANPGCLMVGDGINDSLAMMNAGVGVAVSGGVDSALRSAGVYMTQPGLKGILDLLRISREAQQIIRQNLTISLIYNTLGGILALSGFINPFLAAVLMPVSSGFIIFSTWLKGRS